MLRRARSQPELVDDVRAMMGRQIDRLTRLVDDLLDVTRISRGHAYLQRAPLDLAREFWPEAVLLDIGLPGMDGYDVARRVRAMPGGQHVLLVAVTGWGQDEDKRRSREAGFDEHLTKPVDMKKLRSVLLPKAAIL